MTNERLDHAISLMREADASDSSGAKIYLKGCVNYVINMKPDGIGEL